MTALWGTVRTCHTGIAIPVSPSSSLPWGNSLEPLMKTVLGFNWGGGDRNELLVLKGGGGTRGPR